MPLDALEVSLQLCKALSPAIARIAQHDAALAAQLRRAASSTALNVAEGARRTGRDRRHLWRVGAGSAAETRTALRVAEAWGYVEPSLLADALALADRVLAMLWRMTQ